MAPDSQRPTKAQLKAHDGLTELEARPVYRCANRMRLADGGCSKGAYIGATPVEEQVVLALLHRLDFAMTDAQKGDGDNDSSDDEGGDDEGDFTDFDRIASHFKKLTDPADDLRRAELDALEYEECRVVDQHMRLWSPVKEAGREMKRRIMGRRR